MSGFEDVWDDDEQARRADIIRRARSEGIEAAYEAALRICKDLQAPAQAQSNASRTLMQIGGLLERADREQQSEQKALSELTGVELQAEVARIATRQGGTRRKQPAIRADAPPQPASPAQEGVNLGVFE